MHPSWRRLLIRCRCGRALHLSSVRPAVPRGPATTYDVSSSSVRESNNGSRSLEEPTSPAVLADRLLHAPEPDTPAVASTLISQLSSMDTLQVLSVLYPLLQRELRGESPLDIFASMSALQRWQSRRRSHAALPGTAACPNSALDDKLITVLYRVARFATASYGWRGALFFYLTEPQASYGFTSTAALLRSAAAGDAASFCRHAGISHDALLYESGAVEVGLPKHFIVVDDASRAVVVAIRGTMSMSDALTDLLARHVAFAGGEAHEGMAHAARAVYTATVGLLREALASRPGYDLILTGHSLGAGTAILLTILLHSTRAAQLEDCRIPRDMVPFAGVDIRCMAFGPPPVFAPLDSLPDSVAASIVCCVHNEDFISRLSLHSVRDLITLLAKLRSKEPSLSSRMLGPASFTLRSAAELQREQQRRERVIDDILRSEPEWLRSWTGKDTLPEAEEGDATPFDDVAADVRMRAAAEAQSTAAPRADGLDSTAARLPAEGEEASRLQIPGTIFCVRAPVDVGAATAMRDDSRDPATAAAAPPRVLPSLVSQPLEMLSAFAGGVSTSAARMADSVLASLGVNVPSSAAAEEAAALPADPAAASSAPTSSEEDMPSGASVVYRTLVERGVAGASPQRSLPRPHRRSDGDPTPAAGDPAHRSTDDVQLDEGVAAEATSRATREQLPYMTVTDPDALRNLPITDSAWRDHVPDMYLNALRQLKEVADRQRIARSGGTATSPSASMTTLDLSHAFRRRGLRSVHAEVVGDPKSPSASDVDMVADTGAAARGGGGGGSSSYGAEALPSGRARTAVPSPPA